MLQSREDIRKDKSVDAFTDAILQRDQPRTAELFFDLVHRDGRSLGDALSLVTEAEARHRSSRSPIMSTCATVRSH